MTNYKSVTPELVDLKITDYCDKGCRYCYQGSTREGRPAEIQRVLKILYALSQLQVFEIAIGGGEPITHPEFLNIITATRSVGMVPNFSTRRLDWARDPLWVPVVSDTVGGFAFSVENWGEVWHLYDAMVVFKHLNDGHGKYRRPPKYGVQHVMGTRWSSPENFELLLETASSMDIPVTLLGYKSYGRGARESAQDYSYWPKIVGRLRKSGKCPRLGIDTCLARDFASDLQELYIDPRSYQMEEGKVSCYIDAVQGFMSRSSYDPDTRDPLDLNLSVERLANQIRGYFERY